ncbi:hypothetical protein D7V94_19340 [Parablautia intestinalis]|uniref:Right handed beta helix domain-containing protein n=1 Tax=Parablautia intestinalis TaxID=2320100 RepID=A0A3A9A9R7_9FIRM|nr:InlB B-repeat-containing protein [Parablautia intestinalis]RKI88392.1 hypothetical protein D7V94_19340 [Parablautia intestinalis]
MGRKKIMTKLLTCFAAAATVATGILGSVPLPARAAEEDSYTVTFEAYEGICETESISVPKGESIILPDASYEGHYLESWVEVTENGNVHTFKAIGWAGSEYTPERSLNLYANWKPEQEQDITAIYEARIGDIQYEELEEAFANAQAGDTIIVLKDCGVSKTLEVTADNITLKSEDAENPVTIRREEEFAGKSYARDAGNVLVGISSGSLATQDIILDGGAVLDKDFNNTGQVWDSPLVYVKGSYAMGAGTILQNNYNTDYSESVDSSRSVRTAGAVDVAWDASMTMDGGLIQDCYTLGAGGGIQSAKTAEVTITSGTIRHCAAVWGGALGLMGPSEASDMELSGNHSDSTGGAVWSTLSLVMTDCVIEGNSSGYDGGGVYMSTGGQAKLIRCTLTGNKAPRGSAVQTGKGEGVLPLVIRNCTITGNRSGEKIHAGGTVCYMNETGIILSGHIVMEDNLSVGYEPCDIHYFYNTGASILLDEDFESDSTFVLGGYDTIKPGRVLIDGTLYHKDASPEQFVWHTRNYRTEKRGENLYLAEVPEAYTVTYDANNSSPGYDSVYCSDPNDYTSEDTVTIMGEEELFPLMGNLVKFGCDFAGWNTEKDGSGTGYVPGQEISLTDDLYLYAQWQEKDLVTLTYIYNGGTGETESEQVIPGTNTVFPEASRKGYRFKGWYEDEELTIFAGNAGEKHFAPRQDASYYAAWEKTEATVAFDADGGEMEGGDITAKIGDTITLPGCTKEGYEFTGWYDGDACAGQAGEDYTVADDVILKAHYVRKEAPVCTVSFDTDGGKEISPMKVEKGKAVKLPEAEKAGYIFLGWHTAKEGGTRMDTEFTVTEGTMLYARWEKEDQKPEEKPEATITFDADGGEMEGGDITAKVGDTIMLPACSKEGYEFTGWYDGDTCAGQAGEKYTVAGDVILKAHYEKKAEITYLITFDPNGGRKAAPIKAAKGEKITLPGTEKSGYVFLGWYTEKKGGILLGLAGDELEVEKDMTVYALWEKEKTGETGDKNPGNCKVVFHTEGGTLKNQTLTIVKGAGLYLPLPEKKGYDFTGWYLDKSLTQYAGAYRDSYRITRDTDFYAKWEKTKEEDKKDDNTNQGGTEETADAYTVKYDANGGTVKESSARVTKGKGVKLPAAEREGYAFTGWYTDKQILAGRAGAVYKPDGDICLYAGWKKVSGGSGDGGTADTGNSSDAKTETSTADTGSGSGPDKKSDTSATGKSGDTAAGVPGTGTEKEPVIQTGRTSPIYFLAAIGMAGILLAVLSVREGKRSSKE